VGLVTGSGCLVTVVADHSPVAVVPSFAGGHDPADSVVCTRYSAGASPVACSAAAAEFADAVVAASFVAAALAVDYSEPCFAADGAGA